MTIVYALLLLFVANGAPIVMRKLFGQRGAFPVDAGFRLGDDRPLFGPSKTWRGIVGSIIATAIAAFFIGLPIVTGALVGFLAMLGDLTSSFIKRRLGLESSSRALGIDQLLEALFPTLALRDVYGFTVSEVTLVVTLFFVLGLAVSWPLFKLKIRDRPY